MFSRAPMPPPGALVIILARFSSSLQNPLSADDQIRACKAFAEKHGWIVVAVFKDEAMSGRVAANRKGYLAAMEMAEAGKADVILATALDRIGRDSRELHDANNRLLDANVVIVTIERGVMSRLEFALFAEFAQAESEKIGQRSRAGQRAATARGRIMGPVPYGYRAVYDDDGRRRIEPDPVTSLHVVRVLRDYAAGVSPASIAGALTREGVPSPAGHAVWSPNTILGTSRSDSGLVRNPYYIGKIKQGASTTTRDPKTGKQIKRRNTSGDWVELEAPWLRIIDDETFALCQEVRQGRAAAPYVRNSRRPDYLLSGKTKCGLCGGAFAMTTSTLGCVNRRVGACTNARRVPRERVEELVLSGLRNRIVRSSILSFFLPEYLSELEKARAEAAASQVSSEARIAEIEAEIGGIMKQIRAGAQAHATQLLNTELETLGAEMDRLRRLSRAAPLQAASPSLTPEEVETKLRLLFDEFGVALKGDARDAKRARDIIRAMVDRIEITPIGPHKQYGGAVSVFVEGPLAAVVAPAILETKTQRVPGAEDTLGLRLPGYRFYSELHQEPSARTLRLERDGATVASLICEVGRPVKIQEIENALSATGEDFANMKHQSQRKRAEAAVRALLREGLIVTSGRGAHAGYVLAADLIR